MKSGRHYTNINCFECVKMVFITNDCMNTAWVTEKTSKMALFDITSYSRCPHTMRIRVYATVGRPSVHLSVCLSHWSTAATAVREFAAERPVGRKCRSISAGVLRASCCRRRRSAANAGSVILTAEEGGSTQTCYLFAFTVSRCLWQVHLLVFVVILMKVLFTVRPLVWCNITIMAR